MFSVFGKSRLTAKKIVDKQLLNIRSDINQKLKAAEDKPQSEKQELIDAHIDEVFESMKVKKCSHELSAPEFAEEMIQLMSKDKINFSHLSIMKKTPKINAEGNQLRSKATRKVLMKWVPLYENNEASA